jgi:predicted metal-dependent hydrolase
MKLIYFIIFIVILHIITRNSMSNIMENFKIVSTKGFNHDYHKVRNDFNSTEDAADLMAQLKQNINILVKHLNKIYPNYKGTQNINKRLNLDNMMEATHENDSTSYTINKGEEIHICLREKNNEKVLHDTNTMMFVLLHELAHIMSDTIGHNKEFKDNFIMVLKEAHKLYLYNTINYAKYPKSYCGLKINSTPIKF